MAGAQDAAARRSPAEPSGAVVTCNGAAAELLAAGIRFGTETQPEDSRAPLQHAPCCADIGRACTGPCRAVPRADDRSKARGGTPAADRARRHETRPQRQFAGTAGQET